MFGAMYVVADLDEYFADPQAYLTAHPLPISDELLKTNRPRTPWKLDQLTVADEHFSHGRSFENGKRMFQLAGCVACHRLKDVGHEIGPDLTKLDPKLGPNDIIGEILDPSQKINEDFYTYTFVLDSGITVSGWIVEEMADSVSVVENPTDNLTPIELEKAEIEERVKSNVSLMPKGLLDQLTREQVLDLVAFVMSHGNRTSRFYHDGHRHD
jgi:putative heme-binding domain-containing protein